MASAGAGANVRLTGSSNVWFDERQPSEIHLTVNDEDLSHPQSGKDGLHLVLSSNPRSANFDPKSFNTLRALLAGFDKPCPALEADESIPRRLDRRRGHLG
ncbi:MAG TPA: hypothetical protein VG318_16550 [Actinomycetota bacterium]|nr:hypothetical protein [Actinomycetota bacterium]